MFNNTKLFKNFNEIVQIIKKKLYFVKNIFSTALFFIFLGFLFGSIFGSFLNIIREYIFWDGFILFFVIIFIEFINFINYKKLKQNYYILKKNIKKNSNFFLYKLLNYFKLGLLFGFFIDAFKVGS
jgi:hypothetical protein